MMGLRLKKIHKQFIAVIGLFLFLTLSLNVIPTYYDIQNTIFYSQNAQRGDIAYNSSSARVLVKRALKSVWNIERGEDRIEVQLNFRPNVDSNLPPKRILVQHGTDGWGLQQGNTVFKELECAISNCELVSFPEDGQTYDARIFKEIDINELVSKTLLASTPRHSDQIWIMFALESPQASPNYKGLNEFINWTATYRQDSTIVTPYDKWVYFDNFTDGSPIQNIRPSENYAKNKTKLAAMFVSNCFASNNRLDFVTELQKHMSVDIYGACGDLVCDRADGEDCFQMLKHKYKFYFAFENANCRDYITEKLFLNALRNGVVPVVMGAHPDDYTRVAPIGSFIHVEDFENAKELANYLLKVDKDDEEYNKFFRWQHTGYFLNTKFWCRICSMLWDPNRPTLSVSSLEEWWRGNDTCIGDRRWTKVIH